MLYTDTKVLATKNLEHLVKLLAQEIIGKLDTVSQSASWLTGNQQQLLRAIAEEGLVSSPLSRKFIKAHNLPATSSIKTALNALADKQLVSRTPQGYSVSDIFFEKWLRRN